MQINQMSSGMQVQCVPVCSSYACRHTVRRFESNTCNRVTALMAAAEKGNPECVKLLLDAGAKVNEQNKIGCALRG